MSEKIERVADALEARFKAVVAEAAGETFEATKVTLPGRDIWLGYARAAVEAMPG